MKLVIVESPYAGDVARHERYLSACLADCYARGESPYASHAIGTRAGVLDDLDPDQRALGIRAGFAWRAVADASVFYVDLGMSNGMIHAMEHAIQLRDGHYVELRMLRGEWDQHIDIRDLLQVLHRCCNRDPGEVATLLAPFSTETGS